MRSTAAALFALSLSTCPASAQDCDCDHVVGLTDTIFDGRDTPVAPGDRICVTAGTREFLRFRHVQGTAEAPVETPVPLEGAEDGLFTSLFPEDDPAWAWARGWWIA